MLQKMKRIFSWQVVTVLACLFICVYFYVISYSEKTVGTLTFENDSADIEIDFSKDSKLFGIYSCNIPFGLYKALVEEISEESLEVPEDCLNKSTGYIKVNLDNWQKLVDILEQSCAKNDKHFTKTANSVDVLKYVEDKQWASSLRISFSLEKWEETNNLQDSIQYLAAYNLPVDLSYYFLDRIEKKPTSIYSPMPDSVIFGRFLSAPLQEFREELNNTVISQP